MNELDDISGGTTTRGKAIALALLGASCACSETVVGQFGPPILLVSTDRIDFGEVQVGTSVERELSVANPGDETLTIERVEVGGDVRSAFSARPVSLSVRGGLTTRLTVTYAPAVVSQEDTATLAFVSNAVSGGEARVLLLGKAMTVRQPVADAGEVDSSAGLADSGVPLDADAGVVTPDGGQVASVPDSGLVTDPALHYGNCAAPCAGRSVVIYNATYAKYVKAVLCSPDRYDLFLGESQNGPFYKIGDTAGHGQDHCELVNPTFTIPQEDDVASGSCPTCAVSHAGSIQDIPSLFGTSMYHRGTFGTPFAFETALRASIHTSCWYECGVTL